MISPSESTGVAADEGGVRIGAPARLLNAEIRGVSRLEFYPLEKPEVAKKIEPDAVETLLKEEVSQLDGRLRSQAEEMTAKVEKAWSEAKIEARHEWEKDLEARVAAERSAILDVCEEFRKERARYFAGVEGEVVKLALAIAARVLHREAKLDPLLLTGVVRVALEKLAEGSAAVLRVPLSSVEDWRGFFADGSESALQIVGDERLAAGEGVLKTNVGRVELGVSAQLEEIERGFFDLMQRRPA
ncbi:MAG: FliH/SctL family protein [Edaphobacter sp.]